MEKCKFCQAELAENGTFCPNCGRNNAEEEIATGEAAPVEKVAAEETVVEETAPVEEAAAEETASAEEIPAEEVPAEEIPAGASVTFDILILSDDQFNTGIYINGYNGLRLVIKKHTTASPQKQTCCHSHPLHYPAICLLFMLITASVKNRSSTLPMASATLFSFIRSLPFLLNKPLAVFVILLTLQIHSLWIYRLWMQSARNCHKTNTYV